MESPEPIVEIPCRYNSEGCTLSHLPIDAEIHENKCAYKLLDCPVSCGWTGTCFDIYQHYTGNHNHLLLGDSYIPLNLNRSNCVNLLFEHFEEPFLFQHRYLPLTGKLYFGVSSLLNRDATGVKYSFILYLFNGKNLYKNLYLPTIPCLPYDNPDVILNAPSIDMALYLKILNNPRSVKMKIKIIIEKLNRDRVDLLVLDKVKCNNCGVYAAAPIFKDAPLEREVICYICAYPAGGSGLVRLVELEAFAADLIYPCRWTNCNYSTNYINIRSHEVNCKYRLYKCTLKCKTLQLFKIDELIAHLSDHKFLYYDRLQGQLSTENNMNSFMIYKKEVFLLKYRKKHKWKLLSSLPSYKFWARIYINSKDFRFTEDFEIPENQKGILQQQGFYFFKIGIIQDDKLIEKLKDTNYNASMNF